MTQVLSTHSLPCPSYRSLRFALIARLYIRFAPCSRAYALTFRKRSICVVSAWLATILPTLKLLSLVIGKGLSLE